jgi:hypothetical protein
MPKVNVEENIKQISSSIEKMTHEIFRLQGMLQTFEGFKQGGLVNIDLPNDPTGQSTQELDSVQEKPE